MMNSINKSIVLCFIFIALSAISYAKSNAILETSKTITATAFSEDGYLFYGQKVKIKIYNIDPTKKIINQTVSGVPLGLLLNDTTGYLEGVVGIEEGNSYPFENIFSFAINYEDGIKEEGIFSIFIMAPYVEQFELIKDTKGKRLATNLKNQDTINYVTDGIDVAIRATGLFETGSALFFGNSLEENDDLTMDFYINNSFFKRENIAPYALNGDLNGSYNNLSLKEGTYTIGAKLYSKSLRKYVSEKTEITIVIVNPVDQVPLITGINGNLPRFLGANVDFTIAATNPTGTTLQYSEIGLPEALTLDPTSGRITGAFDINKYEENVAFEPFTIKVANENYTDAIEIRIPGLQAPVINSITMVNGTTDMPITGFENIPVDSRGNVGLILEITSGLTSINIVANTNIGAITGGVIDFTINNKFSRRESAAPYALAGDLSGNYLDWKYPQDDIANRGFQSIQGTATIKKSRSLMNVGMPINLSLVLIRNINDIDADRIIKGLTIAPNPATDFITLNNLSPDRELGLVYQITSITTGAVVQEDFIGYTSNRIAISSFPKGMYTIVVATESGISPESFHAKFIKQ